LEVPVLFEVTMLVRLDPKANYIASDSVELSLGDIIQDILYDLDDIEVVEVEVKRNDK
jgi:hypothetical protein